MSYRYELHLHTCIGSLCGVSHGQDYIDYYKKRGYQGIFVTDHFFLGNTAIDRGLPWNEWVDAYCEGYEELKELGNAQGLDVFFGWETTYDGDDFLYYGLDKEWLKAHPEMIYWDQKKCYEEVKKAGGYVVQAHPFRDRPYIRSINLHPHQCDAWEIANAGNQPYQDMQAYRYARLHGLKMTCGSDIHKVDGHIAEHPFAMITEEKIVDAKDYGRIIESGRYTMDYAPDRVTMNYMAPGKIAFLYDEENVGEEYNSEELL